MRIRKRVLARDDSLRAPVILCVEILEHGVHGGDGGLNVAFHRVVSGAGFVVEMAGVRVAVVVEAVFRAEQWCEGPIAVFLHSFVEIEGGKGGFGLNVAAFIHHISRAAA